MRHISFSGFEVGIERGEHRYFVETAVEDTPSTGFFLWRAALEELSTVYSWGSYGGVSLIGQLAMDWEPAHNFVGLHAGYLQDKARRARRSSGCGGDLRWCLAKML